MMKHSWLFACLFFALLVGCGACGGNNVDVGDSGQILVSPDPIAFSQVAIGESEALPVLLFNVDTDPLTIFDLTLDARDGGV